MFFVTTLREDKHHNKFRTGLADNITDNRCVGYFKDKKTAVKAVVNNWGDINEAGYYKYVVIEQLPDGLYALGHRRKFGDNETWFRWDKKKAKYVRIKKPKWSKQIVNWALG